MEEPWLKVEITKSQKEDLENYYKNSGELRSSSSANSSGPRSFQKAKIINTFDKEKYPMDSEWMIGETPGQIINFFGEKITLIQQKDLYERIE